jgi:hypothetical protein
MHSFIHLVIFELVTELSVLTLFLILNAEEEHLPMEFNVVSFAFDILVVVACII